MFYGANFFCKYIVYTLNCLPHVDGDSDISLCKCNAALGPLFRNLGNTQQGHANTASGEVPSKVSARVLSPMDTNPNLLLPSPTILMEPFPPILYSICNAWSKLNVDSIVVPPVSRGVNPSRGDCKSKPPSSWCKSAICCRVVFLLAPIWISSCPVGST